MLAESEQIQHCPLCLAPDRKSHSCAESPVYLWNIFRGTVKEVSLLGGEGEDSGGLVPPREEFIRKDQY